MKTLEEGENGGENGAAAETIANGHSGGGGGAGIAGDKKDGLLANGTCELSFVYLNYWVNVGWRWQGRNKGVNLRSLTSQVSEARVAHRGVQSFKSFV